MGALAVAGQRVVTLCDRRITLRMDEGCRWAPGASGVGSAVQAEFEELQGWVPAAAIADIRHLPG